MRVRKLELFADYFQFYLQDEQASASLAEAWTEEANRRRLAVSPDGYGIGVGTARNMTVPVRVEVRARPPRDDLGPWDHVVECSVHVPSGQLVVAGCTDYFPDAARIDVAPGWHRARVYHGGLGSVSPDRLEGKDRYRVALWPAPPADVEVLKQGPVDPTA
jgi:hypothetical protein